jgi:hypothetical protein
MPSIPATQTEWTATPRPPAPLLLERTADGELAVWALTVDGVRDLGRHARVADAWAAIDAVDSPLVEPPASAMVA